MLIKKNPIRITVAYGDGIGPEIMENTLKILRYAKAEILIDTINIGQKLYEQGHTSGILDESLNIIKKNKILLKAPITTPQGGGYKSLNVTLRKKLGLYANIRPVISYNPYIKSNHKSDNNIDLVVIRENEEDLYSGIEYRYTNNIYSSLKLISETGSRKIIKYAFEYARLNNRRKVTCLSKDNIMKFSDGIFHKIFNLVAKEYPDIEAEHHIIDIGAAKIACYPENFDVIVTSNLYGDIISDITAETSGSVGIAGSSNIGTNYAMFEAIHGSAPDIAGKNIANPSALLNASMMMLEYIGQYKQAKMIRKAWLKTIQDGMHTADIYNAKTSKTKLSTSEFTDYIISQFDYSILKDVSKDVSLNKDYVNIDGDVDFNITESNKKELVGVDIYIDYKTNNVKKLINKLNDLDKILETKHNIIISILSSKGLLIWNRDKNDAQEISSEIDFWAIRFTKKINNQFTHKSIISIMNLLAENNIDFVKIDNLYNFDDERGYSLLQGQ